MDAAPPPRTGVCLDGWCWANALPIGDSLSWLGGTSERDVWAVAPRNVYHYDGARWSWERSQSVFVRASWADAPGSLWVLNDAELLHRTAGGWVSLALPSIGRPTGVWAPPGGLPWAAGTLGVFERLADGTWANRTPAFTTETGGYAVWGDGAGAVYVAGMTTARVAVRRGAGAWADVVGPSGFTLGAVGWLGGGALAASSGTNMAAVFDGTTWRRAAITPCCSTPLSAPWGSRASDVWIADSTGALHHWDGARWSNVAPADPQAAGVRAVWAAGAGGDLWLAGAAGALLRWRGGVYAPFDPARLAPEHFGGFGASVAGDGAGAGEAWIHVRRGARWSGADWRATLGDVAQAAGLWVHDATGFFAWGQQASSNINDQAPRVSRLAVTDGGVAGGALPVSGVANASVYGGDYRVVGTGPSDVWITASTPRDGVAVGAIQSLRWDGAAVRTTTRALRGLTTDEAGAPWAVDGADVLRLEAGAWAVVARAPEPLLRVGAVSASDVWVTLASGGMRHWDGRAWSAVVPTPEGLASELVPWRGETWAFLRSGQVYRFARGALTPVVTALPLCAPQGSHRWAWSHPRSGLWVASPCGVLRRAP